MKYTCQNSEYRNFIKPERSHCNCPHRFRLEIVPKSYTRGICTFNQTCATESNMWKHVNNIIYCLSRTATRFSYQTVRHLADQQRTCIRDSTQLRPYSSRTISETGTIESGSRLAGREPRKLKLYTYAFLTLINHLFEETTHPHFNALSREHLFLSSIRKRGMRRPPSSSLIRIIQFQNQQLIPIHMTKIPPFLTLLVRENSPLSNESTSLSLKQRR